MPVFQRADFLIPREEVLPRWPVVACDQFTSQPEYWRTVARSVGDAPSAYHLIFPEAELDADADGRIERIHRTMRDYLERDVFRVCPNCYVYVERTLHDGTVRRGVLGVIDLEAYDYRDEAKTPVRATERTVVSRIPPRVKIRAGGALESSHVLLLCSDPADTLISAMRGTETLYDLELMLGGGRLRGRLVTGAEAETLDAALARYEAAAEDGFCYAVGDGNHSLAAAKACWEEIKKREGPAALENHPARWATVELENLFDASQRFEPIHRLVRGVNIKRLLSSLQGYCAPGGLPVRWRAGEESGSLCFGEDALPLAVLQQALDSCLGETGGEIDYIHGAEVALALSAEKDTIAFLLPGIGKDTLFRTIACGGVLPRKTFSMGRAEEKRYYLECRKIIP